MASTAVVKGLQNALNRFYGVTLGAPIAVDGKLGPQTLGAINSVVEWMPSAGYDTMIITSYIGGQTAEMAFVTTNAAEISNVIDWLANANEFDVGATPNPPSVPAVQTSAGKRPAAMVPRGKSQIAAASLLGLGLPNWAVYAGGAGLALALVMLVIKRKPAATAVAGWDDQDY